MTNNETEQFFDRLAPTWDSHENHDSKVMTMLLDSLNIQKGEKILDLACGTGAISTSLYQRSLRQVTALDLSSKMIEIAKSKNIPENEVDFQVGDFYQYEGRGFDLVVCFNAYPHFLDLERFKKSLLRVLAPNGRFAILHDLSRTALHRCHSGEANLLSRELLDPITEGDFYNDEFTITQAKESDDFYLLIGERISLTPPSISTTALKKRDKRQERTINSIYEAFTKLIQEKDYEDITVEDILKEAKVARSTFYAHFQKKEDVLNSVSNDLFHHVFSNHIEKEKDHDFSKSDVFDYDHFVTHICYHLMEDKDLINGILKSQSKETFLSLLSEELQELMKAIVRSHKLYTKDVPETIQIHQLTQSFLSLINYWISTGCKETPEQISTYFFRLHE